MEGSTGFAALEDQDVAACRRKWTRRLQVLSDFKSSGTEVLDLGVIWLCLCSHCPLCISHSLELIPL